jgi:hypothetical protein
MRPVFNGGREFVEHGLVPGRLDRLADWIEFKITSVAVVDEGRHHLLER